LQTNFVQSLSSQLADLPTSPSIYRAWEAEEAEICQCCEKHKELKHPLPSVPGMPEAGVFTFSMETREACVAFYLELLLSLAPKNAFPVDLEGNLDWAIGSGRQPRSKAAQPPIDENSTWVQALKLMLRLLSPWDLVRLSHAWYRPARVERPCLFSRQWFTGWGMLGQTRPGLIPLELPKGETGEPTPVSGTWYLGILSGGTAVRAGAQIIKQLTSPDQELFKFNRGVGLPVRRALYEASPLMEGRQRLPYARRMLQIAARKGKERKDELPREVLQSRCPFFRETIRNYRHISPLFMGMIVDAAKRAVRANWLWSRKDSEFNAINRELVGLVKCAAKRCAVICNESIHKAHDERP
jgi:hypothetical protein